MLQLLLGQISEAIYFALFMILTKSYKNKRTLFIGLMTGEYIFLKHFITYSTWFHIIYFVLAYIIMKILYKDECNITNIFTLGIASIFLIISSFISYTITYFTCKDMMVCAIINRILLLIGLFLFRKYLPKLNNLYSKLWNRGKHKYKMKSTTFRALNLVIFNISFFVINLGILFHELYWS